MDGPNVNWAFYTEICNDRAVKCLSKLLPTDSCGLHSIHGSFKTGANSTGWNINKILKALHQILHDTPVRRVDYIEVTGSATFPLPFCGTRWVDDEKVAVRAINIWNDVCQLYGFWQALPKSKRSSGKSYVTVKDATNDCLTKLRFFAYIGGILQEFLTVYQCTKPMSPYLYDDLHGLLKDIVSKFLKSKVLAECKTSR